MANIRIKDLPAFSGTIPSNAVFALETDQASKKVELSTLRSAIVNVGPKSVTANGQYQAADDGLIGFDTVDVDVQNSYTTADEGKVVQNGALVAQSQLTVTQNGAYDTTTKNSVIVDVAGGSGGGISGLAYLGVNRSEAVRLAGQYGPLGNDTNNYIIPLNEDETVVNINTIQPFELKITFKQTEDAPLSPYYIVMGSDIISSGDERSYVDLPMIYMMSDGTLGYNLYSGTRHDYTVDGAWFTAEEFKLTKGVDAYVRVVYDGTNMLVCANDGRGGEVVKTYEGYTPVGVSNAACCFGGGNAHIYGDLAQMDGAYINIENTYIRQGNTTLWPTVGEQVLIDATFTENGAYAAADYGANGFGNVLVQVSGGGRCPRSEETTIYEMDDFYAWFTFVSLEE